MKAMIFAAGLGTRLKPYTDKCPKALVQVNNKTLLEHNIRYLQRFGIYEVIINVHHFAEMIEDVLFEHGGFGSSITISDERAGILETGGGLKNAAHYFAGSEAFVVINVDVLTNLDLGRMIGAHNDSEEVIATLAVMKRSSGRQLLFDTGMHLCGWMNSTTGEQRMSRSGIAYAPFAFSGIQVLSPSIFDDMPFEGKFSLIDVYLHRAVKDTLSGYDHTGNLFIDVGKPGSIEQAEYLFQ